MANITINSLPTYPGSVDGALDIIPIYDNSTAATVGVSRNNYLNIASNPVGLTDSQTLTNKILTNPTINSAVLSGTLTGTYTIGGTPTFPASVATLTGSQTLTNKVLTSPTINSPTITNAALSSDTITGFSNASNGTIYGMSVTAGVLASAALVGSVNTAAIASGIQVVDKSKIPYKFSVYRSSALTSNNSYTKVAFDTKTFDTGSNFDVVTNFRFTAPITGFYAFSALVGNTAATATQVLVALYKNGSAIRYGSQATAASTGTMSAVNGILSLNATDYIEVYFIGGAGSTMFVGQATCYFDGYLISAT